MKKIGLWMAALVAITVGGVYAGWTYAENAVPKATLDKGIQLEDVMDKTAAGHYTLTADVDTANTVNNKDLFYFDSHKSHATALGETVDENNIHQVVLVINCSLTVVFAPNENATQAVRDHGLDTTISFTLTKPNATVTLKGQEETVFTTAEEVKIQIHPSDYTGEGYKWTESADGTFSFTLDKATFAALLAPHFVVSDAIDLENSSEHTAFANAITGLNIYTFVGQTGVDYTA